MTLLHSLRKQVQKLGIDVVRYRPTPGDHPVEDMARHLGTRSPLVIDVGANVGQSVRRFKAAFPSAVIHSFEPHPDAFRKLSAVAAEYRGVTPWNVALGSAAGRQELIAVDVSTMSSFLPRDKNAWGGEERVVPVEVLTVDDFIEQQGIERIDILKADTQGTELEVFKGAGRAMRDGRVQLVYFEHSFRGLYVGTPPLHEVLRFLSDHGFELVSMYDFNYRNDFLSWCDVLCARVR